MSLKTDARSWQRSVRLFVNAFLTLLYFIMTGVCIAPAQLKSSGAIRGFEPTALHAWHPLLPRKRSKPQSAVTEREREREREREKCFPVKTFTRFFLLNLELVPKTINNPADALVEFISLQNVKTRRSALHELWVIRNVVKSSPGCQSKSTIFPSLLIIFCKHTVEPDQGLYEREARNNNNKRRCLKS